jgi:hypothetical protein
MSEHTEETSRGKVLRMKIQHCNHCELISRLRLKLLNVALIMSEPNSLFNLDESGTSESEDHVDGRCVKHATRKGQ